MIRLTFFQATNGSLTFDNGITLSASMPEKQVLAHLSSVGGQLPGPEDGGMVLFPPCPVPGGVLAPLCLLQEGKLAAVTLVVQEVGQRSAPTAEQQRAFLFSCFRIKDPCPDTRRTCHIRGDFGTLLLSTDPRSGHALARVLYSSFPG